MLCDLAAHFLALAQKQEAIVPLMVGHRLVGSSSLHTGNFVDSRAHFDRALALYDPSEHSSLATRFGQDVRVSILSFRSITLWILGNPEGALADVKEAVQYAREIGHAATLIYALAASSTTQIFTWNYASVRAQTDEAVALAEEKGEVFWKAWGRIFRGHVSTLVTWPPTRLTRSIPESLHTNQWELRCGLRKVYRIWHRHMRSAANSMTLGTVSTGR